MTTTDSLISIREISELFFNHIENDNQYSVEKLKLILAKYDEQQNNLKEYTRSKQMEYYETYESKRVVQNDNYDRYIEERGKLYDEKRNYENIKKLAKMQFQSINIPDIFTYMPFDNVNLSTTMFENHKNNQDSASDSDVVNEVEYDDEVDEVDEIEDVDN